MFTLEHGDHHKATDSWEIKKMTVAYESQERKKKEQEHMNLSKIQTSQ